MALTSILNVRCLLLLDDKYLPDLECNYTRVPNHFYDVLLPRFKSLSALMCYEFLMRKTLGWGKTGDWLTLTQFVEGTGLSRRGVINGLQWLEENDFIWCVTLGCVGQQKKLYFLKTQATKYLEKAVREGVIDEDKLLKMLKVQSDARVYRDAIKRGSFPGD